FVLDRARLRPWFARCYLPESLTSHATRGMTWNAWPASRQQQRSLRMLFCDFKCQVHRLEASASARCKATSVLIRWNCSTVGPPGSPHYGAPNWLVSISIQGVKSRARINWQARSNMQFISPKKLLRLVYHCACSTLAAGSHGHLEPRIIPLISPLCEKNCNV